MRQQILDICIAQIRNTRDFLDLGSSLDQREAQRLSFCLQGLLALRAPSVTPADLQYVTTYLGVYPQQMPKASQVSFTYTNHAGCTTTRVVQPLYLVFRDTPWHLEPQWFLHAFDEEKKDTRHFAVKDIQHWKPF